MLRCTLLASLAWLLFAPLLASAHPLLPVAITLRETAQDTWDVQVRRPSQLPALALRWPSACLLGPVSVRRQEDQTFERSTLRCSRDLAGRQLTLSGLSRELPSAIVHLQYRNGESARGLLALDQPTLVLPRRSSLAQVLLQFGRLGAQHLLEGLDHLLFTAGLLLLGFGARTAWLLSAFTLGHSLTLALLVVGGLSLPRAPVEIGIALSLIGLALGVLARARPAHVTALRSLPSAALLTFAVGLLHGLGFADGLQQLALPRHALWPALLGFNLGVEVAQLAVLALLLPLVWLLSQSSGQRRAQLQTAAGYLIGSLAAMWCLERSLALF